MDNKIVRLLKSEPDVTAALEIIESLRAAVTAGELKAFVVVGLEHNHTTREWFGSTKRTTKLELIGMAAHLSHSVMHDDQ